MSSVHSPKDDAADVGHLHEVCAISSKVIGAGWLPHKLTSEISEELTFSDSSDLDGK